MSRSFRYTNISLCILLGASLTGCLEQQPGGSRTDGAAYYAYRSAVNEPPHGWTGPVFKLSHDYPSDPGRCPKDVCTWLAKPVNFSSTDYYDGWDEYMDAILDYVKKGQDLAPSGWKVRVDGETRWYHVPWMTFSEKSGREFIHGMTNERDTKLSDLLGEPHSLPGVSGSASSFETWAFGVYNPWGGSAFGGTWGADGKPRMKGQCDKLPFKDCLPAGLPFPEGTLVAKLLFTTATPKEVGYLRDSPKWTSNRHIRRGECARRPQPVRLVQMDVAVVDARSPTRWVYGTYAYNGTLKGKSPWARMSPLGVQWGGDPGAFPAVSDPKKNEITQTALARVNIYEHFGCQGRLAGPVDNKLASCMSCHGNGYAHAPPGSMTKISGKPEESNVPPIYGFPGICTKYNAINQQYFSNKRLGEKWPQYSDVFPMDTSLQMLVAFSSYGTWNTKGKAATCASSGGS